MKSLSMGVEQVYLYLLMSVIIKDYTVPITIAIADHAFVIGHRPVWLHSYIYM